jgi:pyrroloquinoline quinone (PQQ) biosynthesis protein C
MASSGGRELFERTRAELADVERAIRGHRWLEAAQAGRLSAEALVALAAEQRQILASDRRSFAQLAARFPQDPAGGFFLDLAAGEGTALGLLADLEAAVGVSPDRPTAYELQPGCQAYPAFMAWLAINGTRADMALALLANLEAWGANCARVGAALRERYGLDERAVAFFSFFAEPPPDAADRALAVLDAGLRDGEAPDQARRATRLLQAYELLFWDTLATAAGL